MAYTATYKYQNDSEAYEDTEIFNVNFSEKSLVGSTYYKKKPQRVTFESFDDSFYTDTLILDSGAYKNISNYTIEIYYDSVLKFSGVIDLSLLTYDVKRKTYSVTAYDNMYLLKQFPDMQLELNDDEGVAPLTFLYNFITEVNKNIPWSISVGSGNYTFRNEPIAESFVNKFDPEDFFLRCKEGIPSPGSLYLHDTNSAPSIAQGNLYWVGSPEYNMQPQLLIIGRMQSLVVLAESEGSYDQYDQRVQYNVRAEIWQYYNMCGWQEREDLREEWTFQPDFGYHLTSAQERAMLKYDAILGNYNASQLNYNTSHGGDYYTWTIIPEDYNLCARGEIGGEIKLSTNLKTSKLVPDYTVTDDSTKKKYNALNFLNASLLYYDASLFCNESGQIILANKYPDIGSPTVLSREDIIEHRVSKVLTYDVELVELDALKGDQTTNKELHKKVNLETQASIYQLDLILFGDNDLTINTTITDPITTHNYIIISIRPNEKEKLTTIKAWRV